MRKIVVRLSVLLLFITAGSATTLISCKGKKKTEVVTTPETSPAAPVTAEPAPVVIAPVDSLTMGVTDATKDFPTVKTSVKDGVITLTGEIKKDQLKTLMMSLHTLHPKKIDNQLIIK